MRRPGYREAVMWLVLNDDVEWANHDPSMGEGSISVTGALVCDLFGVEAARLRADILRGVKKHRGAPCGS